MYEDDGNNTIMKIYNNNYFYYCLYYRIGLRETSYDSHDKNGRHVRSTDIMIIVLRAPIIIILREDIPTYARETRSRSFSDRPDD